MSDNTTIQSTTPATAPAGLVVAGDDISSVFYQRMKISAGADGAAADVPGDGAAGLAVGGSVAHDGVDSGNPVKVGGKARGANPTAVADGDRANLTTDLLGRLLIREGQPRSLITRGAILSSTSASETTLLASGGAGVFHDAVSIVLTNEEAPGGAEQVFSIRDATGGTAVLKVTVSPADTVVVPLPRPIPQASANNNWTAQATRTTAWSAFILAEKNTA